MNHEDWCPMGLYIPTVKGQWEFQLQLLLKSIPCLHVSKSNTYTAKCETRCVRYKRTDEKLAEGSDGSCLVSSLQREAGVSSVAGII